MLIVTLSDTHGLHWQLKHPVPEGDVLVHTGDWQSYGKTKELRDFNRWLGTLPHKHKVVIAGNHDRAAYINPKDRVKEAFTNAIYLQDERVEIQGVRFYGAPWTPMFFNWYFMLERGSQIRAKWEKIAEDTDILLTHGPPLHKLDWSPYSNQPVGCEDLREAVKRIKPSYHVFGHMHGNYGSIQDQDTVYVNASICNEKYKPVNKPYCFYINDENPTT